MRKILFTCIAVAILFGFTANVNAELKTYTYEFTTADLTGWEVATLLTSADKTYVNPTASGGKYNNAASATTWSKIASKWENKWGSVDWTDAAQGNRSTWTNKNEWIAAVYETENKVANGFFAFKYSLKATDVTATSVAGTLNLTLAADDYIAAIYANGALLYSANIEQGKPVGNDANQNGNWLTLVDKTFDVTLVDSMLDLIFVVHNTNAAGSSNTNPMGLYAKGSLTTNIELISPQDPDPPITPSEVTPEPATLLILGLGVIGAGIAARRRMSK